jgi:hypothetical protein
MARWAIVDTSTGKVTQTIVAEPAFIATRYPSGTLIAIRYATGSRPDPEASIVTRDAEPGATWDGSSFTRAPSVEPTPEDRIEQRAADVAEARIVALLRARGVIP